MSDKPFPLLELPSELRLMIYEQISITTRHHVYEIGHTKGDVSERPSGLQDGSQVILVTKSLPVSIFSTCSTIRNEAAPVLETLLSRLRSEPLRFIMDVDAVPSFVCRWGGIRPLIWGAQDYKLQVNYTDMMTEGVPPPPTPAIVDKNHVVYPARDDFTAQCASWAMAAGDTEAALSRASNISVTLRQHEPSITHHPLNEILRYEFARMADLYVHARLPPETIGLIEILTPSWVTDQTAVDQVRDAAVAPSVAPVLRATGGFTSMAVEMSAISNGAHPLIAKIERTLVDKEAWEREWETGDRLL